MRILWAGIGPGHATGYGQQTAVTTRLLRDAGHEVVLALFGEPPVKDGRRNPRSTWWHPDHAQIRDAGTWEGMQVVGPDPRGEFRLPPPSTVWDAFGGHEPDLVLVLKDAWVLTPADYRDYNTAVWLVFDTEPLGVPDREFFEDSGARAVCASLAGRAMARDAGLDRPLYVPHGIDTALWTPGDKDEVRGFLGLPADAFVAGICAQNVGPRKAWGEQFAAFAAFRKKRPGALLLVHADPEHPEGVNLYDLAHHLAIREAVIFGAHTAMDGAQMANWFRSLDVLMAASYGEGFGLPIVQAQACGIPVIGTRCSAITEKIPHGTGWLVPGQEWWNPHHQAWWTIPSVKGITAALEKAHRGQHASAAAIRGHAMRYDAAYVAKHDWTRALEELADGRR